MPKQEPIDGLTGENGIDFTQVILAAAYVALRDLIDEACLAIAPWGERGRRLEALAHFVLERDH